MNEASNGWGSDEDLRPTPQTPPKPNEDITEALRESNDPTDKAIEQTIDSRINQSSNPSTTVAEVVSVSRKDFPEKELECPLKSPKHKSDTKELLEVEVELEENDPVRSECNPTDSGNDNEGADRPDSRSRAQVRTSGMPWSDLFNSALKDGCEEAEKGGRQEPGLIRKLTGGADPSVKKRFSARSLSRRSKRSTWDGSVSDRSFSRPSSNPCVSTFEPLGMIPKEAQETSLRSRVLLRGRPRSQPAGDILPPDVSSSIPACRTEANVAVDDDDIGRVQMAPKRSAMVQCRKIELPLKREEDVEATGEIHSGHNHVGQGVLTFAPFFGSKVSRGSKGGSESSRRSSCCGNGSPRAAYPELGDGNGKGKIGKDARSWSFNLEDLGPETGEKKIALFPRHETRGSGGQTKGIGDCIDLLWKGIPRDSASGFSRSGHEVVCRAIADILGDDRFLDPEETWSKFALRRDSKQKNSFAMSGVMQAMGLSGVKGMFLHLARMVYRAGLAVDWGVLHDDLLSRLGKMVPRNTLSKSCTESGSILAKNTRSGGGLASPAPPVHEKGAESRKPWEGTIPDTVKRSRKLHISPDMLLQARAADRSHDFSGSLNQHRSFVVLLPLSASRLDDVRWKQRTRGGRGNSPALPHTPLRHIRRTRTL
ncbi:hypothetical protein BSKO_07390 [Bryopsis sp. KO-2023]|nr:hypothetical protein BSKO_07390 [Bryopsis sp. KO-2023]